MRECSVNLGGAPLSMARTCHNNRAQGLRTALDGLLFGLAACLSCNLPDCMSIFFVILSVFLIACLYGYLSFWSPVCLIVWTPVCLIVCLSDHLPGVIVGLSGSLTFCCLSGYLSF